MTHTEIIADTRVVSSYWLLYYKSVHFPSCDISVAIHTCVRIQCDDQELCDLIIISIHRIPTCSICIPANTLIMINSLWQLPVSINSNFIDIPNLFAKIFGWETGTPSKSRCSFPVCCCKGKVWIIAYN